ncbi:F-box-like domain protein, partial [Rhizoctonia solani 123E]
MHDSNLFILGDLSSELIIEILHCCDCLTILRFATTCKAYHELVAESTSLQLHIELEVNGLELVKGSSKHDATYSVILEDLKRLYDAWLTLDIGEPIVRSLGSLPGPLWDLRENFYIRAFSRSEANIPDTVQFIPLDGQTPDPPCFMFDFGFREFTVDPEQALIAMISRGPDNNTCHVHLCSSITGLPHPLAEHPRLTAEFDFEPPTVSSGFAIEIMEHLVLVKLSYPDTSIYEVLIWDWKSGNLLHRISSRKGMCDFMFLDQRHLVLLASTTGPTEDSIALLVYDISNTAPARTSYPDKQSRVDGFSTTEPILRLEFPRLKESSRISETGFFLRAGPTPGRRIYTKSAAFSCSYVMTLSITFGFHPVGYIWEISDAPSYRVFLDGRSLLNHILTSPHDETTVLPWDAWGPNATRWFTAPRESDHLVYWPYCMAGSKYIPPLSHLPYYSIFDFSPLSVSRSGTQLTQLHSDTIPSDGGLGMGHRFGSLLRFSDGHLPDFLAELPSRPEPFVAIIGSDDPSIMDASNPGFGEPITSRLPYRLVYAIQFIPLDSESPDPPPLMFDFKFNEFTVDPEQGLIAMICRADDFDLGNTCDIHLCSSATGLAHPLAQYPKLTVAFDYPLPPFSSQFALEIMGHRLLTKAAHSGANNYELLIWDWRHGALLHRISSREGMCDFTFLDQRHLVVLSVTRSNPDRAILNKFALMIYAITWDASLQIAANTAHVRVEDISISEPILHLAFPRLRESVRIREKGLFLRSDPTPGRTIYANSAAFSCPRANTLSISLSSDGPWTSGEPRSYRIFVDGGYLLDLIRTNSGNVTSVVPWSAWGVNTRWFTAPEDPSYWICWMSGSRYVRPLSQPPYYCVFEFSSPTVGRFQGHSARSSPASSDVDTGVGALEMNNGFGDLGRLDNYLLDVLADTASGSDPPEPIIVTTCKVYYELVARSISLQLHIELEVSGLELVKGSFKRNADYFAILKDLQRFRD